MKSKKCRFSSECINLKCVYMSVCVSSFLPLKLGHCFFRVFYFHANVNVVITTANIDYQLIRDKGTIRSTDCHYYMTVNGLADAVHCICSLLLELHCFIHARATHSHRNNSLCFYVCAFVHFRWLRCCFFVVVIIFILIYIKIFSLQMRVFLFVRLGWNMMSTADYKSVCVWLLLLHFQQHWLSLARAIFAYHIMFPALISLIFFYCC